MVLTIIWVECGFESGVSEESILVGSQGLIIEEYILIFPIYLKQELLILGTKQLQRTLVE
ncbi:hypothetical protein EKO25_15825 [Bacillus sp. SAJ1]|nr:hypothetical protein EKO25_15825 [Bacillus sp. SAJ1]